MTNISFINNCFGCGVCATACPKNIINIKLNENGFYIPSIEIPDACVHCGICITVCSYLSKDPAFFNKPTACYAAWSKDDNVRSMCSSGGIGFEMSRGLLKKGYKICGVRYNIEEKRAEHYIASDERELYASIGSKYIQSYTFNAFKAINKREKYLVTGTPCQIDSFRRYIKMSGHERNFILMDFFCHGVPSMLLWRKYLDEVEKNIGPIESVSWRNKNFGWHDSWAVVGQSKKKTPGMIRMQYGLIGGGMIIFQNCLQEISSINCS